jgi:iron(III) transport system permease protein
VKALASIAAAAAVLACLFPAGAMLWDSVRGPEGFTLDAYAGVLREERQLALLLRSTLVAGGAALLALVWGVAVGYASWRLRGWRGACVETLSYLPLLLPSLVIAMGWVYQLGQGGFVTGWLKSTLGLARAPIDLYSPAGAAFVLSLCYFPCVSILTAQGFRAIDPAAIRAAHMTAGTWRRLWRVYCPLLAPYLASGALLAFLLAFADFGVPSALMVNVYPIEVFAQFSAWFDSKRAIASCAPPVGLVMVLFVVRHALIRGAPHETAGSPARSTAAPVSRTAVALAVLALLLSLGLPLATLVWKAHGAYVESLRVAGDQVLTSLTVALGGMAMMLAGGLAYAAAWRGLGPRSRVAADALVLLPLLVPGTAVGLGILHLVTADVWPFSALYPGEAVVGYAGAARFLTFPALILAAGFAGIRRDLVQAAMVHGASRWRAVRNVAPLLWPCFAAAATISFLSCFGELSAAVLINPPGTMTLPVRLASLLHFGKDSIVASLCVILTSVVGAVLLLGLLVAGSPFRLRLTHADRAA